MKTPELHGNFDNGCCKVINWESENKVRCQPDTPEGTSGNIWFYWHACLLNAKGKNIQIILEWTKNEDKESPYARNHNFTEVIERVIFKSSDGLNWENLDTVHVVGQEVHIDVQPESDKLFLATDIPYTPSNLNDLIKTVENSGTKIEVVGTSRDKRNIYGFIIKPKEKYIGTIYLQALQHNQETSGPRVLDALTRYLIGTPEGKLLQKYLCWRIVPVVDIDGLFNIKRTSSINPNRDWKAFELPETSAIRDWLLLAKKNGERFEMILDLHMGWASKKGSAASLTRFSKTAVSDEYYKKQIEFGEYLFKHTDWVDNSWWELKIPDGWFNTWVKDILGSLTHCIEISRFQTFIRSKNQWENIKQSHSEKFGMQLAQAIGTFFNPGL
ncbi:MAG: M14 family zinc carboxypeptidase [Elusimicrobia bacterium]|nr:M14 family zinc carboxypeptidase [Elusimicrobiota bacterium]